MIKAHSYLPKSPVWLAALGARTAVGSCAASTAAAVRAGLSGVEEDPLFRDASDEPILLARDPFLPPEMRVGARIRALLEAVAAQVPAPSGARGLIVVAAPEPRPGLPDDLPERIAAVVRQGLVAADQTDVRVVPGGHAAGILALGMAARALDDGAAGYAMVVGVDSYLEELTLEWLEELDDLKTEDCRDGFHPGEAVGAVLLMTSDLARALKRKPLGRLGAVAVAEEPNPYRSGRVSTGEGLSAAILGLGPLVERDGIQVDDIICDLNGLRFRSEDLTYTLLRTQHLFRDAHAYQHPADVWGDVGAASGPLFALLAAAAQAKHYASGPRTMLWAASDSGQRAAAILDFPAEVRS